MVANCMKTNCKSSDLILFGYKQLWRQYFQKFSDIWFMGLWLQSTNKKLHTLELEHGVQLDTCRCFLLLATGGHIVLLAEHCITMTTLIGENREGIS